MPHPNGEIQVVIKKDAKDRLKGFVSLPKGTSGIFIYGKKLLELNAGSTEINL
jgi:hypothetical protein